MLLAFWWATAGIALGDHWGPANESEFLSAGRQHRLVLTPHSDWADKPGHCRATLFKGEEVMWSRYLINNHAPVDVYVADSGDYVLTMDEWHSVGELPVVIYGARGELVRAHSTESLGLAGEAECIKRTTSSYWWNEDAISFFGPEEETFFIRLHWGKQLLLRLSDGALMDEEWYARAKGEMMPEQSWQQLNAYGKSQVHAHATRLLGSEDARERKTGALVCGQERFEASLPALRELLSDKASYTTNRPVEGTRVFFVRKAAREALEAMGEDVQGVVAEVAEPQ